MAQTWADEPAQPLTFHLRKIEFSRDLVIIGEYGGPVFETVWLAPIKLKHSADEDEETSEIDNLHFNLTLRDENGKEIDVEFYDPFDVEINAEDNKYLKKLVMNKLMEAFF